MVLILCRNSYNSIITIILLLTVLFLIQPIYASPSIAGHSRYSRIIIKKIIMLWYSGVA
jgi:hypothetical protein